MKSVLPVFLIFFYLPLFAQEDSLDVIEEDTMKWHSVKKAMILSAVVPGAGQIYNHMDMPKGQKKAFWKVPLIYAGLGATGYFLISNNIQQKALKTEYNNRMEGNPTDPQWEQYDNDGILTLYNQYLDRRDLSILGFGAIYLLQIADAGIEAHFVRFDISKDLSMQIRPSIHYNGQLGFSASLNFR
jgi:hypothetical protein